MASNVEVMYLLGNNGDRIPYTVATGGAIAKNAVCTLTTPMTVTNQTAADVPIAGVAAEEKTATDGKVTISIITNAVIKCKVKTDVTVGIMVSMDADDGTIDDATATDIENGIYLGWALETATGGEFAAVRMRK